MCVCVCVCWRCVVNAGLCLLGAAWVRILARPGGKLVRACLEIRCSCRAARGLTPCLPTRHTRHTQAHAQLGTYLVTRWADMQLQPIHIRNVSWCAHVMHDFARASSGARHGGCTGSPWKLHGSAMEVAWARHGGRHGLAMEVAWDRHGSCVGSLWVLRGFAVPYPWYSHCIGVVYSFVFPGRLA